ncbi:MAG: alpha/beta hydrolase [Hyphomicrobiales bacterium]|nr:MAG: alpha/beta hydrolase [Hyphomicrobiales bacterium]
MKVADADLLLLPDRGGLDADHWQARWEDKLSTARRVEQADWHTPDREDWVARLVAEVEAATRPVVLVAHGLGVLTAIHAAPLLPPGRVVAGYFVALHDPEDEALREAGFTPAPRDPLPFPALLVASRTDATCAFPVAEDYGYAWGTMVIDAGDVGHIDSASGHGPWPEGSLTLGRILGQINPES